MMIDYMRGRVPLLKPLPNPIHDGHVLDVSADGEVRLSTAKRKRVIGSYEAVMVIRAPSTSEIEFEGNPAKFLQGHNLYGTPDPIALLWAAFRRLEAIGVLGCRLEDIGLVSADDIARFTSLSRIDCTAMMLLDNRADVLWLIASARETARLRDRGKSGLPTGDYHGGVLFGDARGKTFTHRQFVWYSKGLETEKHPLPDPMRAREDVMEWVNRSLRLELRLGRNYLRKRGLRSLCDWTAETAAVEWEAMMARIDWNEAEVRPDNLENLSPLLRGVYALWLSGADLHQVYPRPTFYRHRSAILKALAVDIAIPKAKNPTAHVVPFKRLEPKPAGRPVWADSVDDELRRSGAFAFGKCA